jgi:AcrR family transcriptional regulator
MPYRGIVTPRTSPTGPPPDAEPRQLRRDAARNRETVLEAAAEVFAESGLNASYDEIARRAGVGAGTVYRRFPERAELVRALFDSQLDHIEALADDAAGRPDAWPALCWFLEQVVQMQTANRGFKEALGGAAKFGDGLDANRDRLTPALTSLLDRAKQDGALRADVEPADIGALMLVLSSFSTELQPELWRRYFTLVVDALAPRPGSDPLPLNAPAQEEIVDIIRGLHTR